MINTRGGRFTVLFYLRVANNRLGFKSVMIPLLSEQQLGDVIRLKFFYAIFLGVEFCNMTRKSQITRIGSYYMTLYG
jgi:hypothetical protein